MARGYHKYISITHDLDQKERMYSDVIFGYLRKSACVYCDKNNHRCSRNPSELSLWRGQVWLDVVVFVVGSLARPGPLVMVTVRVRVHVHQFLPYWMQKKQNGSISWTKKNYINHQTTDLFKMIPIWRFNCLFYVPLCATHLSLVHFF